MIVSKAEYQAKHKNDQSAHVWTNIFGLIQLWISEFQVKKSF